MSGVVSGVERGVGGRVCGRWTEGFFFGVFDIG